MKQQTRSFYEGLVRSAVERVALSLDEALNLAELARPAALSPLHFHRIFRGMVGETPLELHRRLRLERAAFLLANTDTKISSIASAAGYETHEAFTRSFREAYGASPSDFRSRAKDCADAPRIDLNARCGIHYSNRTAVDGDLALGGTGRVLDVRIENYPERRVAAIAHVGPYHTLDLAFARLYAAIVPTGLWRLPDAELVTVYHDDYETTPHSELRSEVGLVVPREVVLPEGLSEFRILAGRYARTTHVGSYQRLADSWLCFMGEWLPYSGHRIAEGSIYGVFRDTPTRTPIEELRVDLYLPVM